VLHCKQVDPDVINRILTIGVHGFTADAFFSCLNEAGVDLLVDVRQRRGVRGADYAFANHNRLVAILGERGIAYHHALELAPTTAIRETQYAIDDAAGVGKRSRDQLSPAFIDAYQSQILDQADLDTILTELDTLGSAIALLCVERLPAACHRSLAAEALAAHRNLHVEHLVPGV
jgi:uncharacterized protein (DUF488 family)